MVALERAQWCVFPRRRAARHFTNRKTLFTLRPSAPPPQTSRYCRGVFTSTYKKTIGVDFLEKTIEVDEVETVKLMIWDTAGQEEFDALTASYYRGTGCCALVFSTIDRASFEAVEKWKRKVEEQCGPTVMVLVQNKVRKQGGSYRSPPPATPPLPP